MFHFYIVFYSFLLFSNHYLVFSILFYSIFYSMLFYAIPFYAILFYILFYSLFYILFYSILFYSILFYSILQSGIYWVTLVDYYGAAWGVLLTGLVEVVAISYIYGRDCLILLKTSS